MYKKKCKSGEDRTFTPQYCRRKIMPYASILVSNNIIRSWIYALVKFFVCLKMLHSSSWVSTRDLQLQEKPSVLHREHSELQNMKILNFFAFGLSGSRSVRECYGNVLDPAGSVQYRPVLNLLAFWIQIRFRVWIRIFFLSKI